MSYWKKGWIAWIVILCCMLAAGSAASADAGEPAFMDEDQWSDSEERGEAEKHYPVNYNTAPKGITGPDGQVISGYTWEMYDAAVRERAKEGIRLKIGGNQIEFPDQKPLIEQGRVLVPMRPVFESAYVQCRVYWDADEGKATVRDQRDRQVTFIPGQRSYAITGSDGNVRRYPLDVPAAIIDGRVMLPLRALLETFAYQVSWYADEQLILIYDTHPAWRRLMKAEDWQKALAEDCVPCALVKEAQQ